MTKQTIRVELTSAKNQNQTPISLHSEEYLLTICL